MRKRTSRIIQVAALILGFAFLLFLDIKVINELGSPAVPAAPQQTIAAPMASDTIPVASSLPRANKRLVPKPVQPKKPDPVVSPAVVVNPDGAKVIALVNAEREKLGLKPLKENAALDRAAQQKAEDMVAKQYWAHTSPTGKKGWDFIREQGYAYRTAGENLAADYDDYPGAVAGWMASPTHRKNITDTDFTETGVGIAQGNLDGHTATYITQLFGEPYTP